jgi:uncharacterized membrane protein YhaH (DUF805 family)
MRPSLAAGTSEQTMSWYAIQIIEAVRWFRTVVTNHYNDVDGRARPAEYWCFMLVYIVIQVVLALVQSPFHTKVLSGLVGLGLYAPGVTVHVRRLHDIDKSGWWLLISVVPFIGGIVLIYWLARPGTSGPNKFGPDPMESAAGVATSALGG